MVKNVIFLAVFLFGYTVQAITGFAGNIFCMPVGTLTLGLQSSVSILNATGFLACTVLAALNIRSIHWREASARSWASCCRSWCWAPGLTPWCRCMRC